MEGETGHGGRVKSSKSTVMLLGYGKRQCRLKMTSILWTNIHMNGVLDSLKDLKAIDPQMKIQMNNHKRLTQIPGELEHAVKCRCNHNCTLDEIANTLKVVRKRTNIGKYSPYKSSGFKEKQHFRVEFKEKPKERVAEVAKKKNYCHNCGLTDHYANNCPKAKKKIEKVPEEESPTEDSESDSMGDAIREQSDEDQDQGEEFLMEYQEETPLEI
ncbi:hypothetical protein O181_070643 [Austropuccinia psidii MF-1]|uniref:CCHC-type domain-containing protein n=1 Tax=Austropuccinia psidii MF-1 TaxID=1389203 RepID=A0A9Q3EZI0_9BASI|nr:hypothetical protein [Austropuccinia psidii MF-1]